MKNFWFYFLIVIPGFSVAQNSYLKEIELAEKNFALESQIIGVRAGFLKNMDSAAIGLSPSGFVKMLPTWTQRPEVKSTLLWEPKSVFASENGLWGSTHGPWYTKDSSGQLVNPGYFFTVWQRKQTNESFKFVLDMGIQLSSVSENKEASSLPLHTYLVKKGGPSKDFDSLSTQDFFVTSSKKSLKEALEKYTSAESALLISGLGRVFKSDIPKITAFNSSFQFNLHKLWVLEKGLAFLEYGIITISSESAKEKTSQYVHIWIRKENKPLLLTAFYNF